MKYLISLMIFLGAVLIPLPALAHPGNTDFNGCHVCRTNCDKWEEPYGVQHCHESKDVIENSDRNTSFLIIPIGVIVLVLVGYTIYLYKKVKR